MINEKSEEFSNSQFALKAYMKSRYTNKDSIFRFINGALIISSKDIWGNPIEIDVSAI